MSSTSGVDLCIVKCLGLERRDNYFRDLDMMVTRSPEPLNSLNYGDLAEAAQFLAKYLESNPVSAEELRKLLPDYIVQAIDYVTGHTNANGS